MTFFPPPQNIMTFNKCSISGKCYGDVLDDNGVQVDPESVSPIGIGIQLGRRLS